MTSLEDVLKASEYNAIQDEYADGPKMRIRVLPKFKNRFKCSKSMKPKNTQNLGNYQGEHSIQHLNSIEDDSKPSIVEWYAKTKLEKNQANAISTKTMITGSQLDEQYL